MVRADFPPFALETVEHSCHLPGRKKSRLFLFHSARHEKICVNFSELKEEQRWFLDFETSLCHLENLSGRPPSSFLFLLKPLRLLYSDQAKRYLSEKTKFFLSINTLPHLDLQDIKNTNTEVRALIHETSEHPLLDVAQRFSKVSFFASSATGCATDSAGYYPHIKPCRCLDPLLWILHQRKVIPASRNYRREVPSS